MLDTVRRYVEAGREVLTPKKAEELARALIEQGQARKDQAGRLARDLVDWSRKSSERLRDTIRQEVQKQMSRAGLASKDEVEALKRRIRELETQARAKPAAASPAATTKTTPKTTRTRPAATTGRPKGETTGATRVPKKSTTGTKRTPPSGSR